MSAPGVSAGASAEELAVALEGAWTDRVPIEPLTDLEPEMSIERAYAVQRAWADLRAARGERTVGRKIGLTSPGMQQQMGVDEPDFGDLWASRQYLAEEGVARIAVGAFVQPRVEGELAFLLGRPLRGPGVGAHDVRDATAAIAPAIEIVDSRIRDWRIRLADTIADNASYGGFVLGAMSPELVGADLTAIPLELKRNGEIVVSETGSAVLGSPYLAVAWLANRLGSFGIGLRAGDIVLSGSFGRAVPVERGDRFLVSVSDRPGVAAEFE